MDGYNNFVRAFSYQPKPTNAIDGTVLVEVDTGYIWVSTNGEWYRMVRSNPPPDVGGRRITNLWVTEDGKLQVEYEQTAIL